MYKTKKSISKNSKVMLVVNILGVIFLIASIAVGLVLISQKQLFNQEASGRICHCVDRDACTKVVCTSGGGGGSKKR